MAPSWNFDGLLGWRLLAIAVSVLVEDQKGPDSVIILLQSTSSSNAN